MADRSRQFDKIDKDPTMRTKVRRVRNLYVASLEFPDIHEKGMNWYGNVHDAAMKSAKEAGKTTRQAAGVVAAVSPNMDWENNNINAFHEIDQLSPKDWAAIHLSATQGRRTDDVKGILAGTGLSRTSDANLIKGHRIWHGGEDPEEVLGRRGAPKTNSFFHNILNPNASGYVTIDGRAADQVVDAMRPWQRSRGIGSAALKTGKQTRYEDYEEAHHRAAAALSTPGRIVLPHEVQAVNWELGKHIERGFDSGRDKGDVRLGQSYQHRLGEFRAGAYS